MNKIILFVAAVSFQTAFAQSLGPIELIKPFADKTGEYSFEGTSESGPCTAKYEPDYEGYIVIEAPKAYFTTQSFSLPVASSDEEDGVYTFTNEEHDERPGGDACGDFGGSWGYKKSLIIDTGRRSVTIRETFHCLLEKNDLKYICQF